VGAADDDNTPLQTPAEGNRALGRRAHAGPLRSTRSNPARAAFRFVVDSVLELRLSSPSARCRLVFFFRPAEIDPRAQAGPSPGVAAPLPAPREPDHQVRRRPPPDRAWGPRGHRKLDPLSPLYGGPKRRGFRVLKLRERFFQFSRWPYHTTMANSPLGGIRPWVTQPFVAGRAFQRRFVLSPDRRRAAGRRPRGCLPPGGLTRRTSNTPLHQIVPGLQRGKCPADQTLLAMVPSMRRRARARPSSSSFPTRAAGRSSSGRGLWAGT